MFQIWIEVLRFLNDMRVSKQWQIFQFGQLFFKLFVRTLDDSQKLFVWRWLYLCPAHHHRIRDYMNEQRQLRQHKSIGELRQLIQIGEWLTWKVQYCENFRHLFFPPPSSRWSYFKNDSHQQGKCCHSLQDIQP